jgi:acyl-CoA ligase (AMP-forming) (exosortase A-associated)
MRVLHDLLLETAARLPGKTAVFHHDREATYAHFEDQSRRLAACLIAGGVRRGERVAVFLEKRFEKVSAIFGISRAGAVFVPIRRLSTAPQVEHILKDSGAVVLITTASRLPMLAEFRSRLPELREIIAISDKAGHGETDWDAALAAASDPPEGFPRVVEPDLAAFLYTSGSTGPSKGVIFSHLNLVAGAKTVSEFLGIGENDRLLSILTFGFDYGLNQLTTAFLKGGSVVLLDHLFPADILKVAAKRQVTGLAAVSAIWNQLVDLDWAKHDLSHLRYMTNSGGAIPEGNVRKLRSYAPDTRLFLMYGLTEAFRSTFLDPALTDQYPTSMGKAIPGEEIMVLDEQGKPVKAGEVGELVHRGVLVTQGYWNAPELTAKRFRPNPMQPEGVPNREIVVFSGDRVRIDERGLLYFVGRNDEMIKCAGNRISPTEIEEVVHGSGLVGACMALGVPHAIYGQSVYVVAAPAADVAFDLEKLKAHCKEKMPPYMIPQAIEVRDSLPRNANGKIDRSLIKSETYARLGVKEK